MPGKCVSLSYNPALKTEPKEDKMVVRVTATKPDGLSSIPPGPREEENLLP